MNKSFLSNEAISIAVCDFFSQSVIFFIIILGAKLVLTNIIP